VYWVPSAILNWLGGTQPNDKVTLIANSMLAQAAAIGILNSGNA
jgi:hypothetical protein